MTEAIVHSYLLYRVPLPEPLQLQIMMNASHHHHHHYYCFGHCVSELTIFFPYTSINKTLPLSKSDSCLQVISTLVLRVLSYTSTAESSPPHKLALDVLLNVDQSLPAIMQAMTVSFTS